MNTRTAASQLVAAIQQDVQATYQTLAKRIASLNLFQVLVAGNLGVLWLLIAATLTEGAKDGILAAQADMAWVSDQIHTQVEYVDPIPQTPPPIPEPEPPKPKRKPVERLTPDINPKPSMPTPAATKSVEEYIARYAKTARQEQEQFGIPASISLAQGILESRYGTSTLARIANNHFGIKCHSRKCKRGHCVNQSDDTHKDFFRKFRSPWESWRAHSHILKQTRYTSNLKTYGHEYKGWAKALKAGGYATDPQYATTLITVIERHQLYKYDNLKAKLPNTVVASASRVKPATYTLAVPR